MGRQRHRPEQIIGKLREVEGWIVRPKRSSFGELIEP